MPNDKAMKAAEKIANTPSVLASATFTMNREGERATCGKVHTSTEVVLDSQPIADIIHAEYAGYEQALRELVEAGEDSDKFRCGRRLARYELALAQAREVLDG